MDKTQTLNSLAFHRLSLSKIMAAQINTVQIPSLCLPRIYIRFDESYVEQVFVQLFGGTTENESCIQRIDICQRQDRKTGEYFNLVFVHFKPKMQETPELMEFIRKIEDGEEVRLMYSHPWFWKVRKNTTERRAPRATPDQPHLVFDEEELRELREHQKKMQENARPASPPPSQTNEDEKK